MRIAVFVMSMLVVTAPCYALQSCMTKDEARKQFATSHLYWHGADHCWDASPGRRQPAARNVQQGNITSVQKEDGETPWRDARSQLLSPDASPPVPQSQPT